MPCPPGLFPLRRDWKTVRNSSCDLLKNVLDVKAFFPIMSHCFPKDVFDLPADNKDHAPKTSPKGPIQRIVQKGFSGRADGVNLFEALVALADSRGQDEKADILHSFSLEMKNPIYSIQAKAKSKRGSGESFRKTRIFPSVENSLPVLAALSSRQAERNHARFAAEGFLSDPPLASWPK
jgi:hypothetical protein